MDAPFLALTLPWIQFSFRRPPDLNVTGKDTAPWNSRVISKFAASQRYLLSFTAAVTATASLDRSVANTVPHPLPKPKKQLKPSNWQNTVCALWCLPGPIFRERVVEALTQLILTQGLWVTGHFSVAASLLILTLNPWSRPSKRFYFSFIHQVGRYCLRILFFSFQMKGACLVLKWIDRVASSKRNG